MSKITHWNICNEQSKEFLLGSSVDTKQDGKTWLTFYRSRYPSGEFTLRAVGFQSPDWFNFTQRGKNHA